MDEFKTIALKKISAGSIYKIYLLGLLCSLVPIGILNGILGAIGITLFAVRWNGEVVQGFSTLIISPCLFALMALMFTGVLGSLSWAGLWFYSQFRPLIVRISPGDEDSKA